MITKKQLEEVIQSMPEQMDIKNLMYKLYVIDKIGSGRQDIREGKVISHEEAKKGCLDNEDKLEREIT